MDKKRNHEVKDWTEEQAERWKRRHPQIHEERRKLTPEEVEHWDLLFPNPYKRFKEYFQGFLLWLAFFGVVVGVMSYCESKEKKDKIETTPTTPSNINGLYSTSYDDVED